MIYTGKIINERPENERILLAYPDADILLLHTNIFDPVSFPSVKGTDGET